MPIFEYVCNDCHDKTEQLVRRSDEPITCPRCGSRQLTLQFSVFGFSLGQGNGPSLVGSRLGGCGCGAGGCACCRT